MSIPKDYFKNMLASMSISKNLRSYAIDLDLSALGIKLDIAQDALDAQVWQDVQQYMPLQNGGAGGLKGETNVINASIRGEVAMYPPNSDYGHYQYEGIVYEDPKLHTAGFVTDDGWKSRRGVSKVPTDRKLKYTQPGAQAHWGEVAMKNHESAWLELVRRALS